MSSVSTEELTLLEGASKPQVKLVAFQQHVINVHTYTHTHTHAHTLGPEPNRKSQCTSVCFQVILSITVGRNLEMKAAGKEKKQVTIILAVLTVGGMCHHIGL
jgi:hypothetical protein